MEIAYLRSGCTWCVCVYVCVCRAKQLGAEMVLLSEASSVMQIERRPWDASQMPSSQPPASPASLPPADPGRLARGTEPPQRVGAGGSTRALPHPRRPPSRGSVQEQNGTGQNAGPRFLERAVCKENCCQSRRVGELQAP